ncbi:hypothetical protein ACJ73_02615 [Blastomyces percursus]|uniref:Uncharacterized protein n=1 Tax=Blastomyces percursus TaxID=1658174 RepID=A0A1J9QC46_9EURO|nr:hypothetical protein ACJ73_02615 [Blastomyces percursus]
MPSAESDLAAIVIDSDGGTDGSQPTAAVTKEETPYGLQLCRETVNRGIYEVVDAKNAEIKKLEEQVQSLHGEMSRSASSAGG